MKPILTLLLLIPILSFGQRKNKGYASIGVGPDIQLHGGDPAFGVYLSGNGAMGKGAYLGIELGYVKFSGLAGAYVPISAKFTGLLSKDPDNTSLMFVMQPGYGAYNRSTRIGNFYIQTKGGFTFYTGLGVAFKTSRKSRAFLLVGYSTYGFETEKIKSRFEGIGIRAGAMLL